MKINGLFPRLAIATCLAASLAMAQASITYEAPKGYVSSTVTTTMDFTDGGSATIYPGLTYCTLGKTCSLYHAEFLYELPDKTSATLTNVTGTFAPTSTQNEYLLRGTAYGVDSTGTNVTAAFSVTMLIKGRSGRGGGNTYTYINGSMVLTK